MANLSHTPPEPLLKHLQARHWPQALLWLFLSQDLPIFQILFFLTSPTFSSLIADLFTIQCLGVLSLYLWAFPPLAQVWRMEYAPKYPEKIHIQTNTPIQVHIRNLSAGNYLPRWWLWIAGCLPAVFTLQASLPVLLASVSDSRGPRAAAGLLSPFNLASSCPSKELLPWAIQFPEQKCKRLYNPAQFRSRKLSFYEVSPTVVLLTCILLAKQCLSRHSGLFLPRLSLYRCCVQCNPVLFGAIQLGDWGLRKCITHGILPSHPLSTLYCPPCKDELLSEWEKSFWGWSPRRACSGPSVLSISFAIPWTAWQAPLTTGLSWQEYWSGLPFPLPGNLPNPGLRPESPASPALQVDSLPLNHLGSPCLVS